MIAAPDKEKSGTFALNKDAPIHNWYSFMEGYSGCLIENLIEEIGTDNISSIYDPFCGTGTTPVVALQYGIKPYYSEVNPFMQKVIESKTICINNLINNGIGTQNLTKYLNWLQQESPVLLPITKWGGFEKFYDPEVLTIVLWLLDSTNQIEDEDSMLITQVLLASVLVRSSKMIRRGDLRYARDGEKKLEDLDIVSNFKDKIQTAIYDIEHTDRLSLENPIMVSEDVRDLEGNDLVDCIITSPPYLNGTNYFRNTKLELKLMGFIEDESEMPNFHSKGIIAGINNVSKRKSIKPLPLVKTYLDKLDRVAYDKRIPKMIAGYFNDMEHVIKKLAAILKDNGYFILDIGDSQFAGVHIPTHDILKEICQQNNFQLYDEEILRQRRSKNGMVLTQRLLKFRLHKTSPVYHTKNI